MVYISLRLTNIYATHISTTPKSVLVPWVVNEDHRPWPLATTELSMATHLPFLAFI